MTAAWTRLSAAGKPPRKRKAAVLSAKATQTEKPTQKLILQWLRAVLPLGCFPIAIMNESAPRSWDDNEKARYFMARKASGVVSGVPDILIPLHGGKVVWIECKRPIGGVLSAAQQQIHADLRALGHSVGIATDPESALAVLLDAGVGPLLRNLGDMQPRAAVVRMERAKASIDNEMPF